MTTTRTAQLHMGFDRSRARTTFASYAAGWIGVRIIGAPIGAVQGSSAPTSWRPRT